MKKKRTRGFAHTKKYPHKNHPANYEGDGGDNIVYATFTHSPVIELKNNTALPKSIINAIPNGRISYNAQGNMCITTIPLCDNVSKVEREKAKREGKTHLESRSYVFPVVFEGRRSALHSEIVGEFDPVPVDKEHINLCFAALPHVQINTTGGAGHYKKKNGKKKP